MTPRYRLVFFDVDSTLVTIEGIDLLAKSNPEIVALTEAAMNGEIPIDEVYRRRLEIIQPTREAIDSLAEQYVASLVTGASELVNLLTNAGAEVHLVTAGIEQAVVPLAKSLGVPERAVHAVRLLFDDQGRYRDFDRSSNLTRAGGKELVVLDLRSRAKGKAAYVGDGVTDLDAKPAVDLFIGFGGVTIRDRVRDAADSYVMRFDELVPLLFSDQS
ncbi:MAG TPA: HAD-IB family phosphatase [Thermoanaerobaculia bacterium]